MFEYISRVQFGDECIFNANTFKLRTIQDNWMGNKIRQHLVFWVLLQDGAKKKLAVVFTKQDNL